LRFSGYFFTFAGLFGSDTSEANWQRNGLGSFSNPYSRCPQYLFCFVTLSAVEGLFSKQKRILAPIGAKK
jgi:hypothetical protein